MIFWRIGLSSTSSGGVFELAYSEYDLISSRGFFHDRGPVFKIDALKGVDTERTTGDTSEALTLTCVAGAGLFFRVKKEQQQQKNNNSRPAPAMQATLTNTSTWNNLVL